MKGYLKSRQFVQLFQLVVSNTNTTQYPAVVWGPIENNETSHVFHRLTHTHTQTHTNELKECSDTTVKLHKEQTFHNWMQHWAIAHQYTQHTWLLTSIPLHMNTHTHTMYCTLIQEHILYIYVCALYCIPYASSSTRFVLKRLWMRYYNAIKSTTHTPPATHGSTLRRTWTWQRRWNRTGSPTRDMTCTYSD